MSGQRIEFTATGQNTRTAADKEEERRHGTQDDGQCQDPSADQLPDRQGEQIEGNRTAKNRVGHTCGLRRIPVQGQSRPVGCHAGARRRSNGKRQPDGDQLEDRLDRKP